MSIGSISGTALSGIQRGLHELDKNALEVARAGTTEPDGDPAEPLVSSKVAQRNIEANVEMLKTADETIGFLLDEMA